VNAEAGFGWHATRRDRPSGLGISASADPKLTGYARTVGRLLCKTRRIVCNSRREDVFWRQSSRRRKFRHFGMRVLDTLFLETAKKQNYISSQQYARAAL
jgi:hypothetical protein